MSEIRRALETLPTACRYHGADTAPTGGLLRHEACCDTGIPARRRELAMQALAETEQEHRTLVRVRKLMESLADRVDQDPAVATVVRQVCEILDGRGYEVQAVNRCLCGNPMSDYPDAFTRGLCRDCYAKQFGSPR